MNYEFYSQDQGITLEFSGRGLCLNFPYTNWRPKAREVRILKLTLYANLFYINGSDLSSFGADAAMAAA